MAATPETGASTTDGTTTPPAKRFFYGWWIVLGAMGGQAVYSSTFLIGFGAFFLPVADTFNTTRAGLAGAFSLARLESGLVGPLQGFLIDKLGSRKVMMAGVTAMGTGFMLLSVVPSLVWFYLVFVPFIALGATFSFGPPVHATIVNWFVRRRTRALAIALSGTAIGGLFVPVLSLAIRELGWRETAFYCGLIILTLGYPIASLMRFRPEPYGYHPDGDEPVAATGAGQPSLGEAYFTPREALRTTTFWVMGIALAMRMMSSSGVPVHLVAYLERDLGFSTTAAAWYLGLLGVMGLGGRLFVGFLGDAMPKRYGMFLAFGLQAVSLLVLALADSAWHVWLFLALFATGHGGGGPMLISARGDYFGRRHYATIVGFMAPLLLLGTVTGPVLAGALRDNFANGYSTAFILFGILAGVSAVTLLILRPPIPKQRRPTGL